MRPEIYLPMWFLTLLKDFFNDFISKFGGFCPFLGDIGPFFRPDLGGELGDGYQLHIYINQDFLRPWEEV
jgi:hypothetical protein